MEQLNTPNISISNSKTVAVRKNPCSLVRFSRDQFERIKSDAKAFGQSVPALLRKVYFERKIATPHFTATDADRILGAINRVGNNVNQIAKHLNSGFREGFQPLLEEVIILLVGIKAAVTVGHERC